MSDNHYSDSVLFETTVGWIFAEKAVLSQHYWKATGCWRLVVIPRRTPNGVYAEASIMMPVHQAAFDGCDMIFNKSTNRVLLTEQETAQYQKDIDMYRESRARHLAQQMGIGTKPGESEEDKKEEAAAKEAIEKARKEVIGSKQNG